MFGVEGRYASALYSAATKKKSLDTVDKDLKELSVSIGKHTRDNAANLLYLW